MQTLCNISTQHGLLEFPAGDILQVTAKTAKQEPTISISPVDPHTKWKVAAKSWLPAAGLFLGLLAVLVPIGFHLDNKIGELQKNMDTKIDSKIGDLQKNFDGANARLQKVEDAVKVLGNQQSNQTQKLIHDLLATAKNTSDVGFAVKAVQAAASLTATLKQQQRPARPEFFQESIAALNAAGNAHPHSQLSSELVNTRIALAEYRSSLMPKPEVITESKQLPPDEKITADIVNHRATYLTSKPLQLQTGMNVVSDGAAIYAAIPPGTNIVTVVTNPNNLRSPSVSGLILIGPQQLLDGIKWKNVTFVNTHIIYAGGPLALDHVSFVNCTFDVPHDRKGEQVVNYATLATSSLMIG